MFIYFYVKSTEPCKKMSLTQEQMKSLLIRDKQFLKELYEGENLLKKKRLLMFANEAHLNTLLKFLHFLANGEIKMKKENFEKLSIQKLNLLKKTVERKRSLNDIISNDRIVKMTFLLKLIPVYSFLLDCLFNE